MTRLISILLYLLFLIIIATLLFFLIISVFPTSEPVVVYLLTLIFTQLLLKEIGTLKIEKL
ncbi:hypothetical protein [Gracilibacillus kekensis]|uniref:Uncharacterized protein n=1 Tax=Gracilibacillus kekensis TaxID=1027249 RepID=A0A1M7QGD5_9BACI|nr:hypothetical protein [Gracilibacillus kekensis]SHN30120.1 hypothetical protein SAMN05216179_3143 [Gracilibacillus kekensis]